MSELSRRVDFARLVARNEPGLRLYGILDAESCARRHLHLLTVASAWKAAGVRLVQYRDKVSSPALIEERAHALRALFSPDTFLLLNDYPDLAADCNFDGVHVGQTDVSVSQARNIVGAERIVGVSTHSAEEALRAQETDCDYVAVGPVFPTGSKADAAPVVGMCGVQAARAVLRKPLVAIGGIGVNEGKQVIDAGANAVAIISGLLPHSSQDMGVEEQEVALTKLAQDFLLRLK